MSLEHKVTTLNEAKTVTVDASRTEDKRIVEGGLEKQIVVEDNRKGYAILTTVCVRCGSQDNRAETDKSPCHYCHGKRFKTIDKMDAGKTQKVINTKTKFKCTKCGKQYDQPTVCCVANYLVTRQKFPHFARGYRCTACKRVYEEKVECCSIGTLQPGKFMLDTQPKGVLLG